MVTTTNSDGIPATFSTVVVETVPTAQTTTDGLDMSDKIALGVGIGIGVPTCIATLWALLYLRKPPMH